MTMAKKTVAKKAVTKRKATPKKAAAKSKVSKKKVAPKKAVTKRKATTKKVATKRKAPAKKAVTKNKSASKKVATKPKAAAKKKAVTKPKAPAKKAVTKPKTTSKKAKAPAKPKAPAKQQSIAQEIMAPTAVASTLAVGDKAPEFITQLGDSGKLSLRDFRGEKVVLYFYPKDDTPGCTQEAKDFTANINKFASNNAVVLGVSKDNWASHCKFKEKYNFAYTFLADTDGAICDLYGVINDKGGIERTTFLIDEDGIVTNVWRNVKVPGHVDAVLAAIESKTNACDYAPKQEELLVD
jgi:thioredoxin-dependent peroxiredoxin